ncbi:PAS domain-containing protein [Teichococcus vastitatis]|uniref:PAS domain-containing protein n=1 Tax=Teichococcus vastitatis TaxID=2307076 RepID=UPI002368BC4F|nr:PAS domain-containing protein [Pseudoroseomonas vastitatis]
MPDTAPDAASDELVQMAAGIFDASAAVIWLVDGDRHWVGAETGLGRRDLPRDTAFCLHGLAGTEALVVPDAAADRRFAGDTLVAAPPAIRFFAGQPLLVEGRSVGLLCIMDPAPRPSGLDARQRIMLRALAGQAASQIALRRIAAERDAVEALRRQTLDGVVDYAIITIDMAGLVTGWNAGACNVLGWTEAEMLGQDVSRIFTAEDLSSGSPLRERARAIAQGRNSVNRWYLRRDGGRFWGRGEMSPLCDAAGGLTGFVKVMRDRTGEHLAQRELEAANERYRLVARATDDAIWDWDLEAGRVLWNDALRKAYGHELQDRESAGAWWLTQIHPADRPRVQHSIHAAIDGDGSQWAEEYRFRRADGSYADVYDRGFVIRDEGGRAVRMIGAMLDLTRRRQAEQALRDSEERLGMATAAAGLGTFDYQVDTDTLVWDDRCRALFGLPPGVPVTYQDSFLAGLHPEDRAQADAAVRLALDPAGPGTFAAEYRTVGLCDGVVRWLSAAGRCFFRDGRPVRLIGTAHDISARRQAEAELRELNETLEHRIEERTRSLREAEEALQQAQKMEAIGQLTGGIAHDFNNLLTGISGSLEILAMRVAAGRQDGLDRYIATAQDAAARAASLTHRLLAFARRQTLDPRPVEVNALVAGMAEMIGRSVGPDIRLEVAGPATLPLVLCDPHQLENALLNLCINARDAMPDGGTLRISTAATCLKEDGAAALGLAPGGYVRLSVADTGKGMPPEVTARAFDPFFTTKPLGRGTGLGLSMVYGFARQSGGQAHIASRPGLGTTVQLHLPVHSGAAEAGQQDEAPKAAAIAAGGEVVLVVEDEASIRLLLFEALTQQGYTVLDAEDAASGLALLDTAQRLDLMVTDIGLPGGTNGRQLADAARLRRPGLPVLFITGYAETAVIGQTQLEAGLQVMTKPFSVGALCKRVAEMLAAGAAEMPQDAAGSGRSRWPGPGQDPRPADGDRL